MGCQINYDKIPASGYVLAYFRMGIVFAPYEKADEGIEARGWKEHLEREDDPLFELHLFNDQKEYRFFQRQDGEYDEFVVSENDRPEGIYVEDMCVEKRYADVLRKIRVVNYIEYTQDGMLEITNYRLAPVPEEEC